MEAVVSSVVGSLASNIFGSMFGGKGNDSTPAPPTPSEPTVMPTSDGMAVKNAKRKSISAQVARRGRASTIMSDGGTEKLGA